jgi:hypothetical protein
MTSNADPLEARPGTLIWLRGWCAAARRRETLIPERIGTLVFLSGERLALAAAAGYDGRI